MKQSRFGRAAKLGGLAAGHAARMGGTKLTRSPEKRAQKEAEAFLETADRIVTVLGTMKGAAMKIGQTLSVLDVGVVPE